ncbi:MAG: hypothetical protein JWP61_2978 [Friedmanniella sp.]|nr:hypothetical protein [Friedmanniella sp.]
MSATVGLWRATYTPGDWVVLAGPTSLVVLEPTGTESADLIASLWSDVVGSSSISEIIGHLATSWGIGMPSFGVFFWTEDGMRSLVRGEVCVVDPATGDEIAIGQGMHTWSEVGLGDRRTVHVRLGGGDGPTGLGLPLVVGAVRASTLTLDASADAVPSSPQQAVGPSPDTSGSVRALGAYGGFLTVLPSDATPGDPDGPFVEDSPTLHQEQGDGAAPDGEPDETAAHENADTELMALADLRELEVGRGPGSPGAEADPQDETELVAQDEAETEEQVGRGETGLDGEDDETALYPPPPSADDAETEELEAQRRDQLENGATELMTFPPLEPEPAGPRLLAVLCPYGHPNPDGEELCRACGTPVPRQQARLVAPPVLAVLRVSDGSHLELVGPVLVGRAPSAERAPSAQTGTGPAAQLLTVLSPGHDISRTHLEVTAEGWDIHVTDLHSTNGTVLVGPGGVREDLEPGQPLVARLGSVVELGDGVSILIDYPQ